MVIISDTSSLIALKNIGELEILKDVYGRVVITPEIENEYGLELPNWIVVEKVKDEKKVLMLNLELDTGESSAIALALDKENSLLIIDERKGRGIAKKLGISIIGILGVIIKAKENGVLEKLKPLIEKLESVDFRISKKLKSNILERVGE